MVTFEEGTATIRIWINGGGVSTQNLARELSEWALWALADGGEPTHEIITVAEADRLRAIEHELGDLARLALHATRRDVEMFVHRLAYRHRGTSLGDALAAQDVVPAVGLRSEGGAS